MKSKFTVFVVFAVFAQSSFARNQTSFLNDLITIQNAGRDTFQAFNSIVNGYSAIIKLLADASYKNENDEESSSEIEAIKNEQIIFLNQAYDATVAGLRPIAGDPSAYEGNEDEVYAALEALIELIHTAFDEFPIKDYWRTVKSIEAVEAVAVPEVGNIWIAVYDIITRAIDSDSWEISNAVAAVTRTATLGAKVAFTAVFAEFKILPIKIISAKTETQCKTCLSAIETQRRRAISLIRSEVRTKFSLFQFIATALLIDDRQAVSDYSKIQVFEVAILTGFEYAFEPLFAALIELAERETVSYTVEALDERLSGGLDLTTISNVAAISFMLPKGCAIVKVNETKEFQRTDALIKGIIDAFELIQQKDTSKARAEIEAIENALLTTASDYIEAFYIAMEKIAKDIDKDIVAEIEYAKERGSAKFLNAFRQIFAAIKIAVPDKSKRKPSCDSNVFGIKSAYTALLADLKNEVTPKFDIIRATNLFVTLENNEISVPFSSLLQSY